MDKVIPPPTVTAVPTADVTAPGINTGPVIHQSYPLKRPEEDANEILIQVRGSILRRIRLKLGAIAKHGRFPWPEALLGLATLAFGGTLGAWASALPWAVVEKGGPHPTLKALVFY